MNFFSKFIEIFLHLDTSLAKVIETYGTSTYAILTAIIFLETGVVATPFLPGDSLLFAAGAFAAIGSLKIEILFLLLGLAAILGDTVNYWIGRHVGPKIFSRDTWLLNKKHLIRAEKFYEIHGGKTIILARFMPIIRTFAPFVAGIGKMSYRKFLVYNITGGIAWVALFLSAGYFFGNLPSVKRNFHYVILAIIIVSLLPPVIDWLRQRQIANKNKVVKPLDFQG